jgi:hypothetical protein
MWDNNEHVDRGDVAHVVLNEGTPARGRDFGAPGHVSANRGLADLDAEFEQLAVDAGRAPKPVGQAHLADQITDFRTHLGGLVALKDAIDITSAARQVRATTCLTS